VAGCALAEWALAGVGGCEKSGDQGRGAHACAEDDAEEAGVDPARGDEAQPAATIRTSVKGAVTTADLLRWRTRRTSLRRTNIMLASLPMRCPLMLPPPALERPAVGRRSLTTEPGSCGPRPSERLTPG